MQWKGTITLIYLITELLTFLAHLSYSGELLWSVSVRRPAYVECRMSDVVRPHFLNNISSETTGWKLMKLGWDIPWMVPYQSCSKNSIPWRTLVAMATKVKNFKNLLLKNHWSNFKIISQKWSLGGPLPKLFKEFWYIKKHGRQGRGQFSLYGYIETWKIFFSKTTGPISK